MAAQLAAPNAAGAAMRSAVRLTVRGRSTATNTPAQVPHASTEPVRATAKAVLAERVAEGRSDGAAAAAPTWRGRARYR